VSVSSGSCLTAVAWCRIRPELRRPWWVKLAGLRWGGGPLALLLGICLLTGCAGRSGSRATEGALEALREEPPPDQPLLAERVGRYTVRGALDELSSSEGLERVSVIIDAAVARAVASTAGTLSLGGPSGPGHATRMSYVERMGRDSGSGFAAALSAELSRQLGPDGSGPLAMSLGSTAQHVSGSIVRGAEGELAPLFPECAGEQRRACLEAEVRQLGRAASAGFMEGVFASSVWPAMAIAFLGGVGFAIGAGLVLSLLRRSRRARHEKREAHA
jgi:hypothetical protein